MPQSKTSAILSSSAVIKWLVIATVIVNVLLYLLVSQSLLKSRQQYDDRAAIVTQNLTLVLEQTISSTIEKVDLSLLAAVDEIERQLRGDNIDERALNAFVDRNRDRLPFLYMLRVTNEIGDLKFGIEPGLKANVADRDFFATLRDDPNANLVISKPLLSKINHEWTLFFARRYNRPDGSFAGIIVAGIKLDHFYKIFAAIDVGRNGGIALRDSDYALIVRYPEPKAIGGAVGQKVVSPKLHSLVKSGQSVGTYKSPAGLDNLERTFSFRKFPSYPLYIIVGLATVDYLSDWRHEFIRMGSIVGVFTILTIFLSWSYYQGWKRKQESLQSLIEQEEKFHTIADFTYDWEFWISPEGKFLYTSPSCKRVTGYDAEAFYSDSTLMMQVIHPDDRNLYLEHLNHVGTQLSATSQIIFRVIHTDGNTFWIEHNCNPIIDKEGKFLGMRGDNRDITEQRLLEQQIIQHQKPLLSGKCFSNAYN